MVASTSTRSISTQFSTHHGNVHINGSVYSNDARCSSGKSRALAHAGEEWDHHLKSNSSHKLLLVEVVSRQRGATTSTRPRKRVLFARCLTQLFSPFSLLELAPVHLHFHDFCAAGAQDFGVPVETRLRPAACTSTLTTRRRLPRRGPQELQSFCVILVSLLSPAPAGHGRMCTKFVIPANVSLP